VRKLRLHLRREASGDLSPLLQGGVGLELPAGTTVQGLLRSVVGLSPEYVGERVATVFLDGKPVDDLQSAVLMPGSVLALSAAMPGLVGGTMRRGGPLASMRSGVSYRPAAGDGDGRPVVIRVKVFNLLVEELGPPLLERGILVTSDRLAAFLSALPSSFWRDCRNVMIDGEPLEPGPAVGERLGGTKDPVGFSVIFEE